MWSPVDLDVQSGPVAHFLFLGGILGSLERVHALAARIAGDYGLLVDEVVMRREGGTEVLRVVLDRPGPAATAEESVSLADCERISQELSVILDVEDVVPESYTLEVSSPGLDRPLRSASDYIRFAGRLAKIVTREPVERQTAFAGRLRGFEGNDVLFENEGGRLIRLPLSAISRARLEVEF